MIEVKQIDVDNINYLIRELTEFEKNKTIKRGLLDAGKVFQAGGKTRLRQRLSNGKGRTGHLLNSFQIRVKKNKAGVLTGFNGGGRHSHLVDRGTKQRFTKSGENRGKMPANRFWSDTESMDYPKAIDKLFLGLEKAIEKINNRR